MILADDCLNGGQCVSLFLNYTVPVTIVVFGTCCVVVYHDVDNLCVIRRILYRVLFDHTITLVFVS